MCVVVKAFYAHSGTQKLGIQQLSTQSLIYAVE